MRPSIESLESRQLFALVIPGTPGPDVIVVSDVAGPWTTVSRNGVVAVFADAAINGFEINCFGGNDYVAVMPNVMKRCIIRGGTGNDVLRGGSGHDQIYGDDGHDYLFGNAGSDYLSGGNQNDTLYGGAGPDKMVGGLGWDRYVGNLDGAQDVISRNPVTDMILGGLDGVDIVLPAP
jgi:Ca2+-binding RTX toxin-like protein